MLQQKPHKQRWPRRVVAIFGAFLVIFLIGAGIAHLVYNNNLTAFSQDKSQQHFVVSKGASVSVIADKLYQQHLIKSAWAFSLYVEVKDLRANLQAGTYQISPSQSTPQIVQTLTSGKVATDLVTILPSSRIDQVRASFIKAGFSPSSVDAALNADQYSGNAALDDKPSSANLEGFLYPDSYQKDANTSPQAIIQESLNEMQQHLTPDIRSAFAAQGLSVYQGVTLASIVEQEVDKPTDRAQVAQVFLKRLQMDMQLGSDVTAFYGAHITGQKSSTEVDTPYNTLIHKGLPPGPIGNVSQSSLQAVAHPAATDWLYFVAGDNGNTYFSKTLEEHQSLTAQYCHKLCSASQ